MATVEFQAKVIYVPFPVKSVRKKGPDKGKEKESKRFARCGVRIIAPNGDRWFYKYRQMFLCSDGEERRKKDADHWLTRNPTGTITPVDKSSWTRTTLGDVQTYRSGTPIRNGKGEILRHPGRKFRYSSDADLLTRAPNIGPVLILGRQQAEAEDEAKRAERMAAAA